MPRIAHVKQRSDETGLTARVGYSGIIMKLVLVILCALATLSQAAPFLTCNPVPATDPSAPITGYVITGLPGSPITTPATLNAATATTPASYVLMYDLSAVPAGIYTVTAAAQNQEFNAAGILSTVTGVASTNVTFALPVPTSSPTAPSNLSIHK